MSNKLAKELISILDTATDSIKTAKNMIREIEALGVIPPPPLMLELKDELEKIDEEILEDIVDDIVEEEIIEGIPITPEEAKNIIETGKETVREILKKDTPTELAEEFIKAEKQKRKADKKVKKEKKKKPMSKEAEELLSEFEDIMEKPKKKSTKTKKPRKKPSKKQTLTYSEFIKKLNNTDIIKRMKKRETGKREINKDLYGLFKDAFKSGVDGEEAVDMAENIIITLKEGEKSNTPMKELVKEAVNQVRTDLEI